MITETVSYPAAFLAGLLSFLSPCVLPLIPAYITFITGFSIEELTEGYNKSIRTKVVLSTVAYVLGFSFVFILLGASASFIGQLIQNYSSIIRIAGGILVIFLGLHLTGLLPMRFLYFEKRLHISEKPLHFLGTFMIGMAFGAGWSPCIGPMLGSILFLASAQETIWSGVGLLAVYSSGLAIPFILISLSINYFLNLLNRVKRAMKIFNATAGILLIIIGIILVTDKMIYFQSF